MTELSLKMEKQYSVQFFSNLLDSLQKQCKSFLDFNQLVEVSGYVCVEIDNTKKERYVLSELVQSCGNVISESYCTKVFKTPLKISSTNSKDLIKTTKTNGNSESASKKDLEIPASTMQTPEDKESEVETNISTDHGLKIVSVSSLAEEDKENIESSNSENEDDVVDLTPEVVEISDPKETDLPRIQPRQLVKDQWEGRDTFVYNFPSDQTSAAQRPKHSDNASASCSKPTTKKKSRTMWHQPAGCSNLDLDEILCQGQDWSDRQPTGNITQSAEDFEMKSDSEDVDIPSESAEDAGDDLAVLSNEYFTAQVLAHTSKALDPSIFHEGASHGPSGKSDKFVFGKSKEVSSQKVSLLNPGEAKIEPSTSGAASVESNPCVLVIDEDSDDIVEVDMEQSSDEDSLELSRELLKDKLTKTPPKRNMALNEEEKQRRRYRSSLKYQRYAVKLFNDFQKKKGEGVRPIQTMHPEKLDEVLGEFYATLRKNNGEEFGSMSLRNVQSHLESYLRDANYPFSLTKDKQFTRSKQILMDKIAQARARAKPAPGKPSLINDDDISILFETGELGQDSPDSLLNTMWFMNSMFLQIKQNADHYYLKWGDIGLCEDALGQEVLECFVGKSEGRKVYREDDDPDQCYVTLYKKYRDRRPPSALTPDSPFYLSPCRVFTAIGSWFSIERASVSRLTGVFKKMATAAGLEAKRLP